MVDEVKRDSYFISISDFQDIINNNQFDLIYDNLATFQWQLFTEHNATKNTLLHWWQYFQNKKGLRLCIKNLNMRTFALSTPTV